jgi:hypothetical protein
MGLFGLFRSRTNNTQNNDAALIGDQAEAQVFRRMLKRQVVRLLPTAVYAQWVKSSYQRDMGPPYPSVQQLRADAIAFLVPWDDGDKAAALAFVEEHFAHLFRSELVMYETDQTHWPPLTLEVFRRSFEVEVIEMVVDISDLQ